jgi:hypothetical protein
MEEQKNNMLSALMINLLKRIIYRDKDPLLWQSLPSLRPGVAEHAAVLGLECVIDEAEGYAYFRQKDAADGEKEIPRLVPRRQLSYTVSLLCILLRKKLIEADAGGETSRVILTKDQIIEMTRLYMPDTGNEAKMADRIESALKRTAEIGFVRPMDSQNETYEVKRILRAFIDADWISSLDEKLKTYMEYSNEQLD